MENRSKMNKQLERDIYYLRICDTVAQRSKCLSRKCGSIIVKADTIVSAGYNGPPRDVKHCTERDYEFYRHFNHTTENHHGVWDHTRCPRKNLGYASGEGIFLCPAAHGERNAITQAAKNGISTDGATLYVNTGWSCHECCKSIINAGIKTLVIWADCKPYDIWGPILIKEAGIELREVSLNLIRGE